MSIPAGPCPTDVIRSLRSKYMCREGVSTRPMPYMQSLVQVWRRHYRCTSELYFQLLNDALPSRSPSSWMSVRDPRRCVSVDRGGVGLRSFRHVAYLRKSNAWPCMQSQVEVSRVLSALLVLRRRHQVHSVCEEHRCCPG